jgi:ABC-type multidrug transport system fused ATPase/permease subunit
MPRFCGLDYRVLYNLYVVAIIILTVIDIPLIRKKVRKHQQKVEEAHKRIANFIQNTLKNSQEGLKMAQHDIIFTINDRLGTIDKKVAENAQKLESIREKLQYEIIDPEVKHKILEDESHIQRETDRLKYEEAKINEMLKNIDTTQESKDIVQYSHIEIVVLNVILLFLSIIIPGLHSCFAAFTALLILSLIIISGCMTWIHLVREK